MLPSALRRAAAVLALAGGLVGVHPSFAARPEPPYRILVGPLVKKKKTDAPAGTTVARTTIKGLGITVEYADSQRRAEFLKSLGPEPDLFASQPGRPERALTFVVTFDNQAPLDAVFQPGNVALLTDKGDRAFPLDFTDLYLWAERSGVGDLQPVVDRATTILFDGSTPIPRGRRLARLLAFRPLEGKWKQFQVHFSFLQVGTETHSASFTFHKEYLTD